MRRQLLAVEARHALAPVLGVARDPRWGAARRDLRRGPRARWYVGRRVCARPSDARAVHGRDGNGQALLGPRAL